MIPESPFFHITAGRPDKALIVLQNIAQANGKKLPPGQLVSKGERRWIELLRNELSTDNTGEVPSSDTTQLMPAELGSNPKVWSCLAGGLVPDGFSRIP